jgi:transposase
MGKTRLGRRSRMFREFLNGVEPSELLIVAIDISKFQPKAALFEYFGDVIVEPFFFTPDFRGVQELCDTAQKALKETCKKKVVFGLENTGHYQENIVKMLTEMGQSVIQINAVTTHEERKAFLDYSKTDDIDLNAIASAVAGGKVTFNRVPSDLQSELRYLTRTRRFLVKERSKLVVSMRIILDHYWPYLQGIPEIVDKKTVVHKVFEDFAISFSLSFLKLVPAPKDALALGESGMLELFQRNHLRIGLKRIQLILRSAELSRPVSEQLLQHYVYHVQFYADSILRLNQEIDNLEGKIEALFCQTRGILLLSMYQVHVITAAEFMAEVGLELQRFHSASAIIKQAGTNPVPSESAGRSGQMCISKQGSPWLREAVTRIGKNLVQGGNPYYVAFANHLSCRFTKQKQVAAANKFIRIAYVMLSKGELFTPKTWQGPSLTIDPLSKLKPENRETARQVLNSIMNNHIT